MLFYKELFSLFLCLLSVVARHTEKLPRRDSSAVNFGDNVIDDSAVSFGVNLINDDYYDYNYGGKGDEDVTARTPKSLNKIAGGHEETSDGGAHAGGFLQQKEGRNLVFNIRTGGQPQFQRRRGRRMVICLNWRKIHRRFRCVRRKVVFL